MAWDQIPTPQDLSAVFPGIKIQNHLATGGQKVVYTAHRDGSDVVLKLIPLRTRQVEERAKREVRAMATIDSPFFVELIDHGISDVEGVPCLVLVEEYVQGSTLRTRIDRDGGSLGRGISVTDTILRVLGEFERHSFVHRDLKPSNIIIQPSGAVKVLDVGIVRFTDEKSLTPSLLPRGPGTPGYAAPEQGNNEKGLQDTRTDFFATGIVMYEAITGEHPFDVPTLSLQEAIFAGERNPLRLPDHPDQLEHRLDGFFAKLTAPEPYQRYRKVAFAQKDLDTLRELIEDL